MVAAISATASTNPPNPKSSSQEGNNQNPTRPPLLPSARDNGVASRRPKSREITSRYMSHSISTPSPSTSRRCPSPVISRLSTSSAATTPLPTPSVIQRSQSAERRRPVTSRPSTPQPNSRTAINTDVSVASKLLFTSTRSLSVSFQGESFSLPISKTKVSPPPNLSNTRKATPEKRRTTPPLRGKVNGGGGDQPENSRVIDQQRWPGRTRQVNSLSRSMDCSGERKNPTGSGSVVRALQQSMIDEGRRSSFDSRLYSDSRSTELHRPVRLALESNLANGSSVPSDPNDTDSVSSGSTSGMQECGTTARGRSGIRGINVPARFWQETNSHLRKLQEPNSTMVKSPGSKTTATPIKSIPLKKSLSDTPLSSPRTVPVSRTISSPLRGPIRPSSPNRLSTSSTSSPSRGMPSPIRARNVAAGSLSSYLSNTPSILSFATEARRGKMGENRVIDAHLLRLLHNRHLQWRFVNARAEAALLVQRRTAEKNLYNAWVITSELRDSVTVRRTKLHLLRQKLKLTSILKAQMTYLEEWALLERDHSSSLSGAIEALKASTLRLPVCGARADIQNVKDAVGSAVDVLLSITSSICSLLPKVEDVNSLVAELANVTAQEQALLNQSKDLLSTLADIEVKECSLRIHILQQNHVPTNLTTQV